MRGPEKKANRFGKTKINGGGTRREKRNGERLNCLRDGTGWEWGRTIKGPCL